MYIWIRLTNIHRGEGARSAWTFRADIERPLSANVFAFKANGKRIIADTRASGKPSLFGQGF